MNGYEHRFFCVGDALGDALGDIFGSLQKRKVLKGDVLGDTKCIYIRIDLSIYTAYDSYYNAIFTNIEGDKIPCLLVSNPLLYILSYL